MSYLPNLFSVIFCLWKVWHELQLLGAVSVICMVSLSSVAFYVLLCITEPSEDFVKMAQYGWTLLFNSSTCGPDLQMLLMAQRTDFDNHSSTYGVITTATQSLAQPLLLQPLCCGLWAC